MYIYPCIYYPINSTNSFLQELREKNWKAMDALKKVEESSELKIQEIQSASAKKLSQVQKEYEDKLRAATQSSATQANGHSEQEAELARRLTGETEKNKELESELERCGARRKDAEARLAQVDKSVQVGEGWCLVVRQEKQI